MKPEAPEERRRAHYALAALAAIYMFNFADRQVLNTLLEPIKQDLGASDKQMGLLAGLMFALFYTFLGIPLARWADSGSRVKLITVGLVVWSAMTAASSYARTFAQLALTRIGVGVGEASFAPAAHSLISDYFPRERRATALAIFTIGANIGTLFASTVGGWIGYHYGWRPAFLVVGSPGLLLAFVFHATVREPQRLRWDEVSRVASATLGEALRYLGARRGFIFITLSAACHGVASYGSGTWINVFLMRVHGLNVAQAALVTGFTSILFGASGGYLVSRLADSLGKRDARWYMWIAAGSSLIAFPFVLLFLWIGDVRFAIAAYVPGAMLGAGWVGPTYAMTQGISPPHMRALGSAIVVFVVNLIGMGLGPFSVGALNDALAPAMGLEAVRYSLMIASVPHVFAAAFSVLAARTLRLDLAEASRPAQAVQAP